MVHTCREPSLAQLLADPMIEALMASDGVDRGELDTIIEAARRRIERASGPGEDHCRG